MSEEAADPREGVGGWVRLVIGTVFALLVPPWFVFTALLVHMAGPDWWQDAGLDGAWTLLGIELIWFIAGAQVAAAMAAIGGTSVLGYAGIRLLVRLFEERATRRLAERYDAVIGDGDALRPDAWDEQEDPS